MLGTIINLWFFAETHRADYFINFVDFRREKVEEMSCLPSPSTSSPWLIFAVTHCRHGNYRSLIDWGLMPFKEAPVVPAHVRVHPPPHVKRAELGARIEDGHERRAVRAHARALHLPEQVQRLLRGAADLERRP